MEKITNLSDDTYNKFVKSGKLGTELRELLNIPKTKKMGIGTTVVLLGKSSKEKDVFKCTYNSQERIYIVVSALDEQRAYCYSIYPKK